jgi:hypothetical protein
VVQTCTEPISRVSPSFGHILSVTQPLDLQVASEFPKNLSHIWVRAAHRVSGVFVDDVARASRVSLSSEADAVFDDHFREKVGEGSNDQLTNEGLRRILF